jgi:hypothetical protein
MALELLPFSDEQLDAAAALLRDAHARHRSAEPLLGEVADFRTQVEQQWVPEGASGTFTLSDVVPAGYLVGARAANDNRGGTRSCSHDQGFRSITTDWRSANLLSSRFRPRRGFRPTYLRLYRAVP